MESGRDLARLIAGEIKPPLDIFEEIVKLGRDPLRLHADALLRQPKGPRPLPSLAKHPPMQSLQRRCIEEIRLDLAALFGPGKGFANVEKLEIR